MLLIGLREFALSCSSAFFGLCFRCASVNALFCRAKPPNASFFSIFTRARPWGALKQTLRVRLRDCGQKEFSKLPLQPGSL